MRYAINTSLQQLQFHAESENEKILSNTVFKNIVNLKRKKCFYLI